MALFNRLHSLVTLPVLRLSYIELYLSAWNLHWNSTGLASLCNLKKKYRGRLKLGWTEEKSQTIKISIKEVCSDSKEFFKKKRHGTICSTPSNKQTQISPEADWEVLFNM